MVELLVPDTTKDIDKINDFNILVKQRLRYKYLASGYDDDTSNDIIVREVLKKVTGKVIVTNKEFEDGVVESGGDVKERIVIKEIG